MRTSNRHLVAFAVLLALVAGAVQTLPAVAQSTDEVEVRIAAQRLADGRTEFALQQRDSSGGWSDRILPRGRYFPAATQSDRWLNSTPLTLGDGLTVRITARRVANGRIEFALQQRDADDAWGGRMLPRSRFFPSRATAEHWLSSTPLSLASTSLPAAPSAPVIAAGYLDPENRERGHFSASRSTVASGIRTDVRIRGENGDLLLDAVCRADESVAIGVRLLTLTHDTEFADALDLAWRIDGGPFRTDRLPVRLVGGQPSLYYDRDRDIFEEMLHATSLTFRVDYRGIHQETIDMTAFRNTPVNHNLTSCGDYGTADPLVLGADGASLVPRTPATYTPVVSANDEWHELSGGRVSYTASKDPFTDRVFTEVRMIGADRQLTLIAVCSDNGILYGAIMAEGADRRTDTPALAQATWRVDSGEVQRESLNTRFLEDVPLVFLPLYDRRIIDEILAGESLTARLGLSRSWTDQFDLRALRSTPVQQNLMHCGNYAAGQPAMLHTEELGREASYEPTIGTNAGAYDWQSEAYYKAERDAFSNRVRTDVRLVGASWRLRLDVVCFDNGTSSVGFRILGLERSGDAPDEAYIIWRVDGGDVEERWLDLEFLGDIPAVYVRGELDVLQSVANGEALTARVEYRGVQEDTFDLTVFRNTPVHNNLVHCGDY